MMDAATFAQQLAETIAWCKPRVDLTDPKWCLRSTELKPDCNYDSADDPTLWNDAHIVQSVVQRRQHAIAGIETTTPPSTGLHGGRLLLCYFDETNHNYGPAEESRWFYDGQITMRSTGAADDPGFEIVVSWRRPRYLKRSALTSQKRGSTMPQNSRSTDNKRQECPLCGGKGWYEEGPNISKCACGANVGDSCPILQRQRYVRRRTEHLQVWAQKLA